ncbi:MAG: hypothetical protein WCO57_15855, partial [Verrucomicrobiota bacterium]
EAYRYMGLRASRGSKFSLGQIWAMKPVEKGKTIGGGQPKSRYLGMDGAFFVTILSHSALHADPISVIERAFP